MWGLAKFVPDNGSQEKYTHHKSLHPSLPKIEQNADKTCKNEFKTWESHKLISAEKYKESGFVPFRTMTLIPQLSDILMVCQRLVKKFVILHKASYIYWRGSHGTIFGRKVNWLMIVLTNSTTHSWYSLVHIGAT